MNKKKILAACVFFALMAAACANDNSAQHTPASEAPATATAAPDANAVFQANCASCHNPALETAPQLTGALQRWNNNRDKLKAFIRNSSKVIADGDTYAGELYNKYNKSVMPAFGGLSDQELDALLTLMQ